MAKREFSYFSGSLVDISAQISQGNCREVHKVSFTLDLDVSERDLYESAAKHYWIILQNIREHGDEVVRETFKDSPTIKVSQIPSLASKAKATLDKVKGAANALSDEDARKLLEALQARLASK